MRVKCLAPRNNGSVSFWFSYVSFRVYCFANACDTLFLPCDWRPLSSGVVWERKMSFSLRRVYDICRGTAHHVMVVIICLQGFFYTAAFSSATLLICFILFILAFILFHGHFSYCVSFQNWKTTFTSSNFSPTTHHLTKLSFVLGTPLFFEPVSKIL